MGLRPSVLGSTSVGRVGALAVALGIGAAVVALPWVAFADTAGSAGAAGSDSSSGAASSGAGSAGAGRGHSRPAGVA